VRTLASLQYRTDDAEEQLREMERRLEKLKQTLVRVDEE
jgi:ABC-type Fe3+-hydroxamate transport system substrate-binding protein